MFIAITSNAHWERFCTEFGLLDLWRDPSLDSNAKRAANRPRVIPRIQAIASSLDSAELVERLERVRVPYAPVNTPLDLLEDPQLNSGGKLLEIQTASGDELKVPAVPVSSDSFGLGVRHQPPALGGHTRELLAELGYSAAEIEELAASGVVAMDGPTLIGAKDEPPDATMTGPAQAVALNEETS